MTLLKELIEAAEQAGRDETILAFGFYPGEFSIIPNTRGALERVVKAAAAKAADDAQADAVRRLGQSNELLADQAEEFQIESALQKYENRRLRFKLDEAKALIKDLQNGASHNFPEGKDCAHCQTYGRATEFLEAA